MPSKKSLIVGNDRNLYRLAQVGTSAQGAKIRDDNWRFSCPQTDVFDSTEGDPTTLKNLNKVGEEQRQGESLPEQSGSRSEAADLLLLSDWLTVQSVTVVVKVKGCREMTNRWGG